MIPSLSFPRFELPRVFATIGSRLPQWPHSLALATVLNAAAKIGISSVIQPEGHEGESVPLILMIHDATNAAMQKALAKIAKLPAIKSKPVMFRVESFE